MKLRELKHVKILMLQDVQHTHKFISEHLGVSLKPYTASINRARRALVPIAGLEQGLRKSKCTPDFIEHLLNYSVRKQNEY